MRRLYIDCDGVLADFDSAFEATFGLPAGEYEQVNGIEAFWEAVRRHRPGFYQYLPLMADAKELMAAVANLRPIILSGCPRGGWAEIQKIRWASRHFPGVPMVTCMAREKRLFCRPGDVLVDDLDKYRTLWESAGGLFIHHRDLQTTVKRIDAAFWFSRRLARLRGFLRS